MRFALILTWIVVAALAAAPGAWAQRWLAVPAATTPLAPAATYISRVVDARAVRASAELYRTEGNLLPRPAAFEAGLAPVLQTFFDRYAPARPGATPLVLRVIGLDVAELTGGRVRAGLRADLYAPQPDSSYRLVQRLALLSDYTIVLGGLRMRHATNLGNLLLDVAARGSYQADWLPGGPACPAAYVLAPEPQPAEQLPILTEGVPLRPGYYHSPTEFWLNDPSEPGQPDVEARPYIGAEWAGEREIKAYRRDPNGQRVPAANVWGFSDGQDLYLRWGGDFHRLQRQGQDFTFRGRVGGGPALQAGVAALNLLMVASVASGGSGVFTLSEAEHPVPMRLHVLTGVAEPVATAGGGGLAARPTQLYLYRPRAARGPAVRVQLAGAEDARELAAGDYLSFSLPDSQPVQLCLRPAGGPEVCLPVAPTPEATTYLEYRPGAATPLLPVPAKTGAAALSRLVR